MLHIGKPPPDIGDLIGLLGPGDILTHAFRPEPNSILDGEGRVAKALKAAKRRGVVIDIGHGSGSFSYRVAEAALEDAFQPDVISTDIHAFSVASPVHDLPTTMTKLLNLGMPIEDIVNAVTRNPAIAIHRPRHGRISEGEPADMVVFEVARIRTTLKDSAGEERSFAKAIRPLLRVEGTTVRRIPWVASGR
jgi:dihydroorotase